MFLWISLNSCPLNLLLVRNHQAEITIAKRLIQKRNNVTMLWVELRSYDQGCLKNDSFAHSALLMINWLDNTRTELQFIFLLLKKQTSNNKKMHNSNITANTNLATDSYEGTAVLKSSSS